MNGRSSLTGRLAAVRLRIEPVVALAVLVLGSLLTPTPTNAQAVSIPATPTSMESNADRMISYRHGERMWQTSDGATHLLINQGSLAPEGTSLQLFSSFDKGINWVATNTWLSDSDSFSTADGVLTGNDLEVVYGAQGGRIAYALLRYDPAARAWSRVTTETVFASTGATAINPAMAVDELGGRWCGFVSTDNTTSATNIRLATRGVGAPAWSDTGLVFGPTEFVAAPVERSARPIPISGGVGMVYTVHEKMYWGTRRNNQAADTAWTEQLLFAGAAPFDTDPYSSHFSIAADSKKNLHLVTVDQGALLYLRYASKNRTWSAARTLTQDIRAAYPQVTVSSTDTVALLVNTQTYGGVLQSANGGGTFSFTHLLTHQTPPADSGISHANPRLESPGYSAGPMSVVKQYVDGATERLMFFSVPLLKTP